MEISSQTHNNIARLFCYIGWLVGFYFFLVLFATLKKTFWIPFRNNTKFYIESMHAMNVVMILSNR